MIDIHSHILPGIDDGARDIGESIDMARLAVADGVKVMACTPHVKPPRYPYSRVEIAHRVAQLQETITAEGLDLYLAVGGDVHIAHDLLGGLENGTIPCLHSSRYFLFEPNHTVMTPQIREFCTRLIDREFIPILTHPERLAWVSTHYDVIREMHRSGVLMQVTAGSLTGNFGSKPQKIAERMLDEKLVDVIASDAHNVTSRPPGLSRARALIADRYGQDVAERLTMQNPLRILLNKPVMSMGSGAPSRQSVH